MAAKQKQYAVVPLKPPRVCKKPNVTSEADCDPGCNFAKASAGPLRARGASCRLPPGSASKRVRTTGRPPADVVAEIKALQTDFNNRVKYVLETTAASQQGSPKGKKTTRSRSTPWNLTPEEQAASLSSRLSGLAGSEVKSEQKLAQAMANASGGAVSDAKLDALASSVSSGTASSTAAAKALRDSQRSGDSTAVDVLLEDAAEKKLDVIRQSGQAGAEFAAAASASGAPPSTVLALVDAVETKRLPVAQATGALASGAAAAAGEEGKGAMTVYEPPAEFGGEPSLSIPPPPPKRGKISRKAEAAGLAVTPTSGRATRSKTSQGATSTAMTLSDYDWQY